MRDTTANATTCLPISGRKQTARGRVAVGPAALRQRMKPPMNADQRKSSCRVACVCSSRRRSRVRPCPSVVASVFSFAVSSGIARARRVDAAAKRYTRRAIAAAELCTHRVDAAAEFVARRASTAARRSLKSLIPSPSPLPSLPSSLSPASGFTLIEMLVVVTIMMIMVAAAATMMQPASDSRRLRETARAVNVYLSSARNRAMETGRPCGVIFRHFGSLPCAMTADQCEVPPCFGGDTLTSCATVTGSAASPTVAVAFKDGTTSTTLPGNTVRRGDLIQLGDQGPYYQITTGTVGEYLPATTSSVSATLVDSSQVQALPWNPTGTTVSYRIFRAPVKGGATPLQLPASAVVDLAWSGYGSSYLGATAMDYTIMFSPNGSVECIYEGSGQRNVTEPIYLLIGKRERVGNTGSTGTNPAQWANWQDPAGYWVVVNPQTGLVTTGNVAVASSATASATTMNEARLLASQAQSIGGK